MFKTKSIEVEARLFKGEQGTVEENLEVANWCNAELTGEEGQFLYVVVGDTAYEIGGGCYVIKVPDRGFATLTGPMFEFLFEVPNANP